MANTTPRICKDKKEETVNRVTKFSCHQIEFGETFGETVLDIKKLDHHRELLTWDIREIILIL